MTLLPLYKESAESQTEIHENAIICNFRRCRTGYFKSWGAFSVTLPGCGWGSSAPLYDQIPGYQPQNEQLASINDSRNVSAMCKNSVSKDILSRSLETTVLNPELPL